MNEPTEPPDPKRDLIGYELYLVKQGNLEAQRSLFDRAIGDLCATGGISDMRLRMSAVLEMEKHLAKMPTAERRPRKDKEHLRIAIQVGLAMKKHNKTQVEAVAAVAAALDRKPATVKRIFEKWRQAAYQMIELRVVRSERDNS